MIGSDLDSPRRVKMQLKLMLKCVKVTIHALNDLQRRDSGRIQRSRQWTGQVKSEDEGGCSLQGTRSTMSFDRDTNEKTHALQTLTPTLCVSSLRRMRQRNERTAIWGKRQL
jgi:hypothetical protein